MPKKKNGYILATVIVFSAALIIAAGTVLYILLNQKIIVQKNKEKITNLQIAEAGINYYLWHLAHDPTDYTDGTGEPGPYVHTYKNAAEEEIGTFSLEITPPDENESNVKVVSTGELFDSEETKTVEADLGIPTFSAFSFITHQSSRFGSLAETFGRVHSNGWVEFNGIAHKLVSSANENPGVFGSGTFDEGVAFPVPAIDFQQISADLNALKEKAEDDGIHIGPNPPVPGSTYPSMTRKGYHIILHPGGFDLYRVDLERRNVGIEDETFIGTYNSPNNGIVFVEDDIWLEGTYDSRITIAVANFPEHHILRPDINIINDVQYTSEDGSVAIGLVAQGHIWETAYCPADLEIDAAILAQYGCFGYDFINNQNSPTKSTLRTFGSIASYLSTQNVQPPCGQAWGSAGFITKRDYDYDPYMLISPPPNFPTTGKFTILSWEEE